MDPLLTRRQTLQSLAFSAVFGGSIFGLIGCGGNGHRGGGGTKVIASSTAVELPAGLPLPTSDLVAGTAYGATSFSLPGFNAKISLNGPTFAYVQHKPSGKFVLFGLVGKGRPGVTPLASAALMVALAVGLVGLPSENVTQGLGLLEADSGVRSLADAIASTMASDPFCLTNGNAVVAASLKAAVQGLGANRATSLATRADDAPLIQVSPSAPQGGARVDQGVDNSIVPTNLKRRPVAAYTYLVGHEPGDGAGSSAPATLIDTQELEPTTGLIGSLTSLGGDPAFEEKKGKAVTLPVSGSDDKSFYETVVLMASASMDEPAAYRNPRYAAEVAGWRTKREELNLYAWVANILQDIFKSVVGGAVAALSASKVLEIVAEMEAVVEGAAHSAIVLARSGEFSACTADILSKMTSDELLGSGTRKIALRIVGYSEAAAADAVAGTQGLAILGIASFALAALAATGALLAATDAGVTYYDILTSPQAAVWQETVLKPKVKIDPHTGEVRQNASIGLSATLVGLPGVRATYTWTLTGSSFGTLTGEGGSGKTITTNGTSVTFATTPSDPEGQVATITVEARDKATGNSLGSDVAKITVVGNKPVIEAGTFTVLTYADDTYEGAVGAVTFGEVKGATSYAVHGTGGNDPAYYHNEINLTYNPKSPGTGPDGKPLSFAVGLSGISGSPGDLGGKVSYMQGRFAGFNFTVTAYFT